MISEFILAVGLLSWLIIDFFDLADRDLEVAHMVPPLSLELILLQMNWMDKCRSWTLQKFNWFC